jgi:hypothetical protein
MAERVEAGGIPGRERGVHARELRSCCLATIRGTTHDTMIGDGIACPRCTEVSIVVGRDGRWRRANYGAH